jgi:hypothetical protein
MCFRIVLRLRLHLNHIETYSQQMSYVCCTVCYTHFLCEAPSDLGNVDKEYVSIWCPNRDSNSDAEALASKTSVSTNSTIGANIVYNF